MTFRDAYLKLTGFYVGVLLIISLIFSIWVYNEATRELQTGLQWKLDQFGRTVVLADPDRFVEDRLDEGRGRIIFNLVVLNALVLGAGAAASYVLARRTMQPIEEAMEAKDRFTADASHELRTPLAAMKTEIEVALRDKKRSKSETDELLLSNLEEIDRMSALAEGLLVLTNDEKTLATANVQLDVLIKKTISRITSLAEVKHITVNEQLIKTEITTDSLYVEKILGILLDNAIKYSPEKATITVGMKMVSLGVTITVTDTGYGIKASDLPHIFDRFYRADTSRSKERVGGHGLGLSIASTLAETLQGRLTVKSTLGKGSTFILFLPLSPRL